MEDYTEDDNLIDIFKRLYNRRKKEKEERKIKRNLFKKKSDTEKEMIKIYYDKLLKIGLYFRGYRNEGDYKDFIEKRNCIFNHEETKKLITAETHQISNFYDLINDNKTIYDILEVLYTNGAKDVKVCTVFKHK